MRPEVRLVLAVSIDGRLAPSAGGAASIGGAPDRVVLEQALAWADAALIGATTLRLHGGTALIRRPDLLDERFRGGRSPQPPALVVSRSGRIPPDLPFFHQPLQRWWLDRQEPPGGDPSAAPLPGFDERLPWSPWPETLRVLRQRGLSRLLVLGGAQLAATLLAEDLLDTLQLTVCPRLLGGPHLWMPAGHLLPEHWQLETARALGEGEVLLRYRRSRGSS
ncbi:RibD family protein [Synechococcus sp. RSCCF101]|uniref:RibD family protein n=1 Tax=Synechococcus sp. RSCCF101 TaxID=2511069 RepID=UPI0012481BBF|nr:dihydrofolate reductase family protein [Synechococcus sp. RSCCF101]QEY32924.1 RibD family protein [Synechococcus sp. RSCCF101]